VDVVGDLLGLAVGVDVVGLGVVGVDVVGADVVGLDVVGLGVVGSLGVDGQPPSAIALQKG
jgi:hypothetical protein